MRHPWRVDAKWLFGIACLIAIVVAGVLYSASKLTEHDAATGVFTGVMTSFAKGGGGEEGFAELQAQAAANPDQEFVIEGATLPVKGSELVGLTYDEAVELVVGHISETFYTDGPAAVEQYFEDAPAEEPVEGAVGESDGFWLGPFALLTQDGHDTAGTLFTFSLIAVAVLAVPLVFFSRRFGRLGSPGLVLSAGAAPFALAWFAVKEATENPGDDGPGDALAEALSSAAGDLSGDFLALFVLGVALMVAAVAGNVGLALWRRSRSTEAPPEKETAPVDKTVEPPPHYTSEEGFSGRMPGASRSPGPGGVPQA